MKITKDTFIKATSEAMSTDSAIELFNAEENAFDMFSMFSYLVFNKIDGKDVNEEVYTDAVAEVVTELLPESSTKEGILKTFALIIFSMQIWDQLVKIDKPTKKKLAFNAYKTVLKSKIDK